MMSSGLPEIAWTRSAPKRSPKLFCWARARSSSQTMPGRSAVPSSAKIPKVSR